MNILAIGAHPDDIEIGCGGTLAAHAEAGDRVLMVTMTAGEMGGASASVRLMEFSEAARVIGAGTVCLGYKDTEVPSGHEPVRKLDEVIAAFRPDRAYIPFCREIHQDHVRTSEAALAACRNVPQVLMYEGPSTYTDFIVNYFVDISRTLGKKMQAIRCHASQGEKEILKIDSIQSLNRFRGYQARAQYAEGFSTFRFIEKI